MSLDLVTVASIMVEGRKADIPQERPLPRYRRREPEPLSLERATELRVLVASMSWTWAKTYAERAPHWWSLEHKAPEEHAILAVAIKAHGISIKFGKYYYRYLIPGDGFKYWRMGNIINRATVTDDDPTGLDQPRLDGL